MAYSDAEVQEALIRLAVNKYDFAKTAEDVGVSARTLRSWDKKYPKKAVPELLDRAIERMLLNIPEEWKAKDWGVVMGILIDKWLLLQGKATERKETVLGWLQQLPDEELDDLARQFESYARDGVNQSRTSPQKK